MTDLKRAFLERELSDAEFKALDNAIKHSPEEALRLAELAALDYVAFGMPKALPRRMKLWHGGGLKLLVAGLVGGAALGGLAFKALQKPSLEQPRAVAKMN